MNFTCILDRMKCQAGPEPRSTCPQSGRRSFDQWRAFGIWPLRPSREMKLFFKMFIK